jgi:hypothetical protein
MPVRLEVRYERSFLLDLKNLEPALYQQVHQFVFEEFQNIGQLYDLPEYRQIGTSGIFYCFELAEHLVSLEVIGQVVKFLRILPKPEV